MDELSFKNTPFLIIFFGGMLMQNARLPDGSVINAGEYIANVHTDLYCLHCGAKVFFVSPTTGRNPFFRTSGRRPDTTHKDWCPEKRELKIFDSLKRIKTYKPDPKGKSTESHTLNLDLNDTNKVKHHGQVPEIGREHPKKKLTYANRYTAKEHALPNKADSLDALLKYLNNSIDILAATTIRFNGEYYSIPEIIIDQGSAYQLTSKDNKKDVIVYGAINTVVKLETVMYLNFTNEGNLPPFTVVIFKKRFKNFTDVVDKLEGSRVLVSGKIEFNKMSNRTQMIICCRSQLGTINKM